MQGTTGRGITGQGRVGKCRARQDKTGQSRARQGNVGQGRVTTLAKIFLFAIRDRSLFIAWGVAEYFCC